MPNVQKMNDRAEIRRRLNADRVWSIYALADLDPNLFAQCDWWINGEGLALVFNGIPIRPIFVSGPAAEVRELLEALPVDQGYLNLRDEHVSATQSIFTYADPHRMHRMVVDSYRPCPRSSTAIALGPEHLEEIQHLYSTGDGAGVAFGAFQLESGFFRGMRDNADLVAVSGVHVVSTAEGVAGVGNVFTRKEHRGRGLAQLTLSAVVTALMAVGIETIGLNVEEHNHAAIAAYERLGFRSVFKYWEGPARRSAQADASGFHRPTHKL